jgi:high-affinity nickel-transport protein
MSLVDSLDSILMLYAYAAPNLSPNARRFAFFSHTIGITHDERDISDSMPVLPNVAVKPEGEKEEPSKEQLDRSPGRPISAVNMSEKANTMSTLSILLTILSILVALR